MYCPNCRNTVPDGTATCNYCGFTIRQEPTVNTSYGDYNRGYAPQSQQHQYNSEHTNNYYGTPSTNQYAQYSNPYAGPYGGYVAPKKKSSTGIIVVVILIIAAIIGGIFLISDSSDNSANSKSVYSSPEKVLKASFEAFNSRDAEAMVSLRSNYANATEEELIEYTENMENFFDDINSLTLNLSGEPTGKIKAEIDKIISVDYIDSNTAEITYYYTLGNNDSTLTTDTFSKIGGKWYIDA